MLVESLVVSSREFSFFFTYFRNTTKITNIFFSMFPTSLFPPFTSLFHSLFLFFLFFKTLKNFYYTRETTGKASIASRPYGFDSF